MPYSLQVDQDEAVEFCTVGFMRHLRGSATDAWSKLLDRGWHDDVGAVRASAQALLDTVPDPDVQSCLRAALSALRDDARVVSVTDGLGPDDRRSPAKGILAEHGETPWVTLVLRQPRRPKGTPAGGQFAPGEGKGKPGKAGDYLAATQFGVSGPNGRDLGNPNASKAEKWAEGVRQRMIALGAGGGTPPPPKPTAKGKMNAWSGDLKGISSEIGKAKRALGRATPGTKEHDDLQAKLKELREKRKAKWQETPKTVQEVVDSVKRGALTGEEHRRAAHELLRAESGGGTRDFKPKYLSTFRPSTMDRHERAAGFIRDSFHPEALASHGLKSPGVLKTQGRAHATGGNMNLDERDHSATFVHEFGHNLEFGSASHADAARDFLNRRTPSATVRSMSALNYGNYRADEVAYEDQFYNHYAGKKYGDRHSPYATEVTSMGLEMMYKDPVGFAKGDPDHFRFTLQQMRRPKASREPEDREKYKRAVEGNW